MCKRRGHDQPCEGPVGAPGRSQKVARHLSHPDPAIRRAGIEYVRRCAELGAELGAGVVIVVPTAVGRTWPLENEQSDWNWAVASISEVAAAIPLDGPRIVLAALNRSETFLVNNLARADELHCIVCYRRLRNTSL